MRLSARAPRRTRKWATKVRNLEQEMRQNNVVFVFARGEKFRQNILIPDFHSRLLGRCVPSLKCRSYRSTVQYVQACRIYVVGMYYNMSNEASK